MRRYLILALAALGLLAAAPSAFATRVIFDPTPSILSVSAPPTASCYLGQQNPICSMTLVNTPYSVDFVDCSLLAGANIPVPNGMTYCLWMNNVTGYSVSKFTFEFNVPSNGGDPLQCGSQGQYVATNNCPSSVPPDGSLFNVSFFTTPAIPNNTDFYLFTDFGTSPGTAKVTLSVPEPGQLGLFGLGLFALGIGYGWRKRRQVRRDQAA